MSQIACRHEIILEREPRLPAGAAPVPLGAAARVSLGARTANIFIGLARRRSAEDLPEIFR
jgi:hypothetical protein